MLSPDTKTKLLLTILVMFALGGTSALRLSQWASAEAVLDVFNLVLALSFVGLAVVVYRQRWRTG